MPYRFIVRLDQALGAAAAAAHRRPARALLAAALLTALGAAGASRLVLDTDLTDLLPKSFESVRGLDELQRRFGGIGFVTIAAYGAEPEALQRFADETAPLIEALPGVRFVEHRRASGFFRDRALYYMSLPDLEEVAARIRAREKWERRQKNPMLIKLDVEPAPPLDFSDVEAKYGGQSASRLAGDGGEYYLDTRNPLVVLLAKPEGISSDLGFARRVVGQVESLLAKQDLRRYGRGFKIQITGTFKKKVDQQSQIARDLAWSSSVAVGILLVYLLFHFRSPLAVIFNLTPVACALVWTYGIVGAIYGSVNVLTGFLAAILGGLGIEHGIHLLGRFDALRDGGMGSEQAARSAFTHTGGAALISALVAALTFLSLATSEFRAFHEFGIIAAIGMMVVVCGYLLILPALLGIADRLHWSPTDLEAVSGRRSDLARWLTRPGLRRPVAVVLGLALVGLVVSARNLRFNYDFAALEDNSLPSYMFDKRTNAVLGYSQTPVVILTSDPRSERAVVESINGRKRALGTASTVDFVASLDDLVPQQQEAKRQVLSSIDATLAKVRRDGLDVETRKKFDDLRRMVRSPPFSRSDLPESVRRQFLGIDEGENGFVLVFPSISLADGAKVRQFAREVRSVELPGGTRLSAAGEAMILADIIDMVTREMPRILMAGLFAVFLAMAVTLGSFKLALLCLSPTVVSVIGLVGLMPLVGVSFNYLNIIVLTVLVGVTVDAGVHLVSRLSETDADFACVYGETGRAICGGILTSAVGFGAMLLADHPGLNSIGQLANIGFAVNLVVTLLGFPAMALPFIRSRHVSQLVHRPEETTLSAESQP